MRELSNYISEKLDINDVVINDVRTNFKSVRDVKEYLESILDCKLDFVDSYSHMYHGKMKTYALFNILGKLSKVSIYSDYGLKFDMEKYTINPINKTYRPFSATPENYILDIKTVNANVNAIKKNLEDIDRTYDWPKSKPGNSWKKVII